MILILAEIPDESGTRSYAGRCHIHPQVRDFAGSEE
jgi:hypothetical protein